MKTRQYYLITQKEFNLNKDVRTCKLLNSRDEFFIIANLEHSKHLEGSEWIGLQVVITKPNGKILTGLIDKLYL